jgi:hypothetical protein
MSGAVGSIRGKLLRLTGERVARNCNRFAVALVGVENRRQHEIVLWRVVVSGASLAVAKMLTLGENVVASGEIFAGIGDRDGQRRPTFSMACRKLIPQEQRSAGPARARRPVPVTPREKAEAVFQKPRQMELQL